MVRIISLVIFIAVLTGAGAPAGAPEVHTASPARYQTEAFQPSKCMFEVPATVEEGKDVVCGYLTVPANHADPSGAQIQLAVAILKATSGQPRPVPLVIAQGGPGGSTIDTYAEYMLTTKRELSQEQDVILFDQRGTLYSRPALYCTEVDTLNYDLLDEDLSPDERERRYEQALAECRARLADRGIDLSAFDSLENANDIEDLRIALGYNQINLYGVSYGTLLALHYMRLHPSSLRSVILDGVLPPQQNFILNVGRTQDQAFTRLFQACQAEPACNRAYPNLEQVLFDTVARLDQTPAHVSMTDLDTGKTYPDVVIDGEGFLLAVFQMLYSSDLLLMLPRMIYEASRGDFEVFARIDAIFVFDRSVSYGMYYSVLCAEDADFTPQDQDLSGVRPEIAEIEKRTPQQWLDVCKLWNVQPVDDSIDDPVQSDVPTLLLSGYFDPITPQQYAEEAAASLSRAYAVVIPTGGHGQMLSGDCPDGIIRQFLADPEKAPDTSCLASLSLPQFYTPDRIVDLRVLLQLLNLAPGPWLALLALLLAILFLWSAALVFPIAWLMGRRKPAPTPAYAPGEWGPPGYNSEAAPGPYGSPVSIPTAPASIDTVSEQPSFLTRIASWLPVVSAFLLTVFLALVVVTVIVMVNENDNRLFYGLAGETRPYFLLPLVFALLALMMLAAGVQLWARRMGGLARRIYYTLLVLTALAAVLLLAYLGMLTAFF